MPSITVEDYLKHIFLAEQEAGSGDSVSMGAVARRVGVVPGTATTMIKSLASQDLAAYVPRQGVRLTPAGRREALRVLRRHRLIELFLVKVVGLDWAEIHDEAERLEHAVSDNLIERIARLLDDPQFDPHGDPIPSDSGRLPQRDLVDLNGCPADEELTVARIIDQEARFLRYVQSRGLRPGARIRVVRRDLLADSVTIQPGTGEPVTLGAGAGAKILVRPAAATA